MSKIEATVEEMVTPICEENGVFVYEVEYKKEGPDWVLRVFIDSEQGVGIDECEAVSRALSDQLDETDPIPGAYCLEVSSPGIERTLTRDWHFQKAIGEEVEAKLFAPMNGSKVLTGTLTDYDGTNLTLSVGKETVLLPKAKCAQVKIVFDFTKK